MGGISGVRESEGEGEKEGGGGEQRKGEEVEFFRRRLFLLSRPRARCSRPPSIATASIAISHPLLLQYDARGHRRSIGGESDASRPGEPRRKLRERERFDGRREGRNQSAPEIDCLSNTHSYLDVLVGPLAEQLDLGEGSHGGNNLALTLKMGELEEKRWR